MIVTNPFSGELTHTVSMENPFTEESIRRRKAMKRTELLRISLEAVVESINQLQEMLQRETNVDKKLKLRKKINELGPKAAEIISEISEEERKEKNNDSHKSKRKDISLYDVRESI